MFSIFLVTIFLIANLFLINSIPSAAACGVVLPTSTPSPSVSFSPSTTPTPSTTPSSSGGVGSWVWWTIGAIGVVIIVVIVAAAGFFVYKKRKQSTYDSIGYE